MAAPKQAEVEHDFNQLFQYGDFEEMAAEIQTHTPDYLRKMFNPNNPEVKSGLFRGLVELNAARRTRLDLALGLYTTFCNHAQRILFNGKKSVNVDQLKQTMRKSLFDLIGAEIDRLPNTAKLKAIEKAKLDLDLYAAGLRFNDMDDSEVEQVSNTTS
jgi:hypothetical protein